MKEYLLPDIERICEIKRGKLYTWITGGFIEPSIQPAGGHGGKNRWSLQDLIKIKLFEALLKDGWKRELAGRIINAPMEHYVHTWNIAVQSKFFTGQEDFFTDPRYYKMGSSQWNSKHGPTGVAPILWCSADSIHEYRKHFFYGQGSYENHLAFLRFSGDSELVLDITTDENVGAAIAVLIDHAYYEQEEKLERFSSRIDLSALESMYTYNYTDLLQKIMEQASK